MRRYMIIGLLVIISLCLAGFSNITAPQVQTGSGIVWQSYSMNDQGDWQLNSTGQNLTQTQSSLSIDSTGLIDQPSLLILRGRIPEGGLTLQLDINITVGATWDLIDEVPGVSMEIIDYAPYSNLQGAPGCLTVVITSSSRDEQDIQLIYHRPWLPDEKAERKLVISTLTFPQSIDLSHEVHVTSPQMPEIVNIPATTDSNRSIQIQTDFPTDFDWRNVGGVNYVTPVRDQGLCGSCWAHAIIGATESALLIDGVNFDRTTLDLSEQYLVSCRTDAMNAPCGGWNSSANNYHLDKWGQLYNQPGAVLESSFPYVGNSVSCGFSDVAHPYKIASYTYVGEGTTWSPYPYPYNVNDHRININLIKTAITNHGPVGAGMFVSINMCESSSCHPYVEPPESLGAVNHDILIVGWHDDGDLDFTDDYWIVKNSDGIYFNDDGYVDVSMAGPVIGTGAYYVDFSPGVYRGDLFQMNYLPLTIKPVTGTSGYWVTLLDEDFEGSLASNWYIPDWGESYIWGQSTCRASQMGGHSLWWVGAGGAPLECGVNYPKGINTGATYGPLDLTNATSAFMKFKIWTNTLPTYEFLYYDPNHHEYGGYYSPDYLFYGASTGEDIYNVWGIRYPGDIYGYSSGWREMILDLSNLDSTGYEDANMLNRSNVYIYFGAVSYDHPYAFDDFSEGIYIDDILIKKCVGGACPLDW